MAFQTLHAHSQFCLSGDHTLEAAKLAIKQIADVDADERFVICLSDANLDRYGIRPKALADILTSNEDVNAYVIFIGSLGDQAHRWVILYSAAAVVRPLCNQNTDLQKLDLFAGC